MSGDNRLPIAGPPIGGLPGWGQENIDQIQGPGGASDREGYLGQYVGSPTTIVFQPNGDFANADEPIVPPGPNPNFMGAHSPGAFDLRGNFGDSNALVAKAYAMSEAAAFPGGGNLAVYTSINGEYPAVELPNLRFFYLEATAAASPNNLRFRAPPREITHEVLTGYQKGAMGTNDVDVTLVTPLDLQVRYFRPYYLVAYYGTPLPSGLRFSFTTAVH